MNSKNIRLLILGFGMGILFTASMNMLFGQDTAKTATPEYIRTEAGRLGMIDPKDYFDKSEAEPSQETVEEQNTEKEVIVTITINKGNTSEDVAKLLKNGALIESEKRFIERIYARNAAYSIQTGTYQFKKGITEDEIINIILKGN